jgi:hypothetical protein
LKRLDKIDIEHVTRGWLNLNDIKFIMGKIEEEARKQNVQVQAPMSREDAKEVYKKCNKAVIISETKKGRPRCVSTLKWQSIIQGMPKEERKRNRT